MKKIRKSLDYCLEYGLKCFFLKLFRRRTYEFGNYEEWINSHKVSVEEANRQRGCLFAFMPKISIAVPAYETPENFLREMIESVQKQTYDNWELCIANGSKSGKVAKIVKEYSDYDDRIKIQCLENKGIVGNSNCALEMCTGDYIGLLDHDDVLEVNALYEVADVINKNPKAGLIYSDEDKMSSDSKKFSDPHFKPDYNVDLLRSNNYICHFCVIRRDVIKKLDGFRAEFEGAQDYDLILRAVEYAEEIVHIPKILYHWRVHDASTAGNPDSKLFAYEAGKKAIKSHLDRMGIQGTVAHTHYYGFYHVRYMLKKNPEVLVIIYNIRKTREYRRCKKSVERTAGYKNLSFLAVNCLSMINTECLRGKYVLFVDCGIKMITKNWMAEMLALCQRKDVGAAGVKIYKPENETIFHAGIILGMDGYAFEGFPRELSGYFHRDELQQDVSGVTNKFIMIWGGDLADIIKEDKRSLLDERAFCSSIRSRNKLVVADLKIECYLKGNVKKTNWEKYREKRDPFYNENLVLKKPGYRICE